MKQTGKQMGRMLGETHPTFLQGLRDKHRLGIIHCYDANCIDFPPDTPPQARPIR